MPLKFVLDTHTVLWHMTGDRRLDRNAKAALTFYPLDEAVLRKSEGLTAILEMHDRQIVATALVLQDTDIEAIILTRDPVIQASGLVKTLW